jgi:hypothetical protein
MRKIAITIAALTLVALTASFAPYPWSRSPSSTTLASVSPSDLALAAKNLLSADHTDRAGAGRKPGSGLAKIDAAARKAALESGITPLDYMLNVMRAEGSTDAQRMEAARGAAPYVHARLAHIETKAGATVSFVARLPSPAASVEAWQEERKLRLLKPPH